MRPSNAILPALSIVCFLGCEVDPEGTQIGNEGITDTDLPGECRAAAVAGTTTYAGWDDDVDTVVAGLITDIDRIQLVLAAAFDGSASMRTRDYSTGVDGDCSSVVVESELTIDLGTTLVATFSGPLMLPIDQPTDLQGVLSATTWTGDAVRAPSPTRTLELRVSSVVPLTADLVEVDCTVNDPCTETLLGGLEGA